MALWEPFVGRGMGDYSGLAESGRIRIVTALVYLRMALLLLECWKASELSGVAIRWKRFAGR